jgi:hypothetical protein
MKYTSLTNCHDINFQSDFHGFFPTIKKDFEKACLNRKAVWAHFFEASTGRLVASYHQLMGMNYFITDDEGREQQELVWNRVMADVIPFE